MILKIFARHVSCFAKDSILIREIIANKKKRTGGSERINRRRKTERTGGSDIEQYAVFIAVCLHISFSLN